MANQRMKFFDINHLNQLDPLEEIFYACKQKS